MSPIKGPAAARGVACGVVVIGLVWALLAPAANAGPYEAIQCARHLGAGHGVFHFRRSSKDFRRHAECRSGDGLGVTHARSRTQARRLGMWVARAPDGTHFTAGRLAARGRRDGGLSPHLLLGAAGGALDPFGSPRGEFKAFRWRAAGVADRLVAELACDRRGGDCGRTDVPRIFLKRARFGLFDAAPPAVTGLGGALLSAPVQRGTQALTVGARDVGSGVRRIVVRVNGRPFDYAGLRCAIAGGRQLALSLSPCPNSATPTLPIDTRLPAFHEGENVLTACADDYADQNPNERCARRRIRVQNACPISDVTAPIWARFGFANGGSAKRVRYGRRPRVVGRLAESNGAPGAGALVCVSERPALPNSTERLVGTPLRTDRQGRVSVRLPVGPSRVVYLTYWRGAERVVTRAVRLGVKARVGLRVRPRRRLHNGETMRLRARLRGPLHVHRELRFLAKPPGGEWVPFSTHFAKRTDADGVAHASHTFRHVSGTQRFRFKVRVPSQAAYPYLSGRSRVGKVTVAGR